jgi:hypothetical protein
MKSAERASEYLNTLPPRYKTFFQSLLTNHASLDTVLTYARFLHIPDLVQTTIPDLVTQLQQFAVTPEQATHHDVRLGRQILCSFFEKKQSELHKHNIIPLVYGSLLYDDPHNLDYDVILFGQQYKPYIEAMSVFDWSDEINALWMNDSGGHITYVTRQQIESFVGFFRNDTHESKINEAALDIEILLGDISVIFSGSPILTHDASLLPTIREHCTTLMLQEPLIPALVTHDLQEALQVRQIRRELLSPFLK